MCHGNFYERIKCCRAQGRQKFGVKRASVKAGEQCVVVRGILYRLFRYRGTEELKEIFNSNPLLGQMDRDITEAVV